MATMPNPDRVFIIAEAGVNHNGSRELAFSLVDAAAAAGADAVKFQTFDANALAAADARKAHYQQRTTDAAESQRAMLAKLELPRAWHAELQAYSRRRGVEFLSTAFDPGSLEFLQTLDLPLYKIPSGEITNGPLLWAFARTGKPLILSTGMATLAEVEQALAVLSHGLCHARPPASMDEAWRHWSTDAARDAVSSRVSLLHCTSQYPAPVHEVNLRAMDTLQGAFQLPVGYSDHTAGTFVAVAAAARGARIIEKHFTTDRTLPGPDHAASLEPAELTRMVAEIRAVEVALGNGRKAPQASEWDTREVARQKVVAARAIRAGERMTLEDMTSARASGGLLPMQLWDLVGTCAKQDYQPGDTIE
jgi:N-acetylneuraminate synthase